MQPTRSGPARALISVLGAGLAALIGAHLSSGLAQAPPPQGSASIVAPTEPVAAKAFAVFEKHCARCHQAGRLRRLTAPAGFANALRLDEVAADPRLVEPGNPDASRLFNVMLLQDMPYDLRHEGVSGEPPSGDELQAVRAWIEQLPRAPRCPDRAPVGIARLTEELLAHIQKAPAEAAKGWRFVSFAHLYNACASPTEMASYRMALTKLLNSLSWRREPVALEPVDAAGTVVRVSLADLGWVAAHWEMIGYSYPYGFMPDTTTTRRIGEAIGTSLAVVRGDWLAHAAGRAPLYYDLLGVPTQGRELHKVLGIDVEKQIELKTARRAGILGSNVTRAERLLERHALGKGFLWRTYDFLAGTSAPSLIESPLPAPAPKGFRHDLSLTMFTLPNGLPAYFITQSTDRRIDAVPAPSLRQRGLREGPLAAGAPCMACHGQGPRPFRDDLRANVVGEARVDRATQELVAAFHPAGDAMQVLVAEDTQSVRTALKAAGVDPEAEIAGLEIISGLARLHGTRLDLARLAAEFGLTTGGLLERLEGASPAVKRLIARLEQGTVARAEVDQHFAAIAAFVGFRPIASPSGLPIARAEPDEGELSLALLADRPQYRAGELVTFTVTSSHDCNLTVISIDKRGRATVIFPNEFEQKTLLAAGRELKLPGERAPYQFRAREAGRESVVAICNRTGTWAEGIVHDWERQRFTVLGDYAAFLAKGGDSGVVPKGDARNLARRRPQPQPQPPSVGGDGETRPATKDIARTGIVIEIR